MMEILERDILDAVAAGDFDKAADLVRGRDRSIDADPIIVDEEALLTLASMGFELEACNVALAVYQDLGTAMDMLLEGKRPYSVDVGGVDYVVDLGRGALSDKAAGAIIATCLRDAATTGHMPTVRWALAMASEDPTLRVTCDVGTGWGPVRCHKSVVDAPEGGSKLIAGIGATGAPIMLAAQNKHIEVVQVLAQQKADVDVLDTYGNRPLHFAVSTGNLALLKVLLAEGSSREMPNKLSFTPLHVAVQNDQNEAAGMLLERKADPSSQTNTLSCSLHLAARQGSCRSVEILLQHRADVDAHGLDSTTPLHMALSQGHGGVVELLLSHGAHLSGALFKAVSGGQVAMVTELLNRGANAGERDGEGRTALHLAVSQPEITEMLLKARTPMTPDLEGKTPLHQVASMGSVAVAKLLLAANADPAFKDMLGVTPLDIARAELSKVWSHEAVEGTDKSVEWFEWAHDQFGVSMANVARKRDLPALVAVLEG